MCNILNIKILNQNIKSITLPVALFKPNEKLLTTTVLVFG